MAIRIIEVPTFAGAEFAPLLDAALGIARKTLAHIEVTYVGADPVAQAAAIMAPQMSGTAAFAIDQLNDSLDEARKLQHAAFVAWCDAKNVGHAPEHHRLDTVFACWRETVGSVDRIAAARARLSDLTVVGRPHLTEPNSSAAFDAAVFNSGRPALLVSDPPPADPLSHALVAWDGSAEASRCVSQSIGLLRAAERVSIFSVPAAGGDHVAEELAASLRWHGIEARRLIVEGAGDGIGPALLRVADSEQASLIVMGAYGHSRVSELLFGGVTYHAVHHARIPLLLTH